MKTEPRGLGPADLASVITEHYGLNLGPLSFYPRGEEAYAYTAETAAGDRLFIRAQRTAPAEKLSRAYAAVRWLHETGTLTEAVAPLADQQGRTTFRCGHYTGAVFPFVKGETLYRTGAAEADILQCAEIMAALHAPDLPAKLAPLLRRETFVNPFRTPILRALERAGRRLYDREEVVRQTAELLLAEKPGVIRLLEQMERLAAQARRLPAAPVVTHGDPNRDNFLRTAEGRLLLTDWGEIARGPRERDLFFFTGEWFRRFLRRYGECAGPLKLHACLFEFYFCRWTAQEIADYTTRIFSPRWNPEEKQHAWQELQPYLPVNFEGIAAGVRAVATAL